MNGRVIPLFCGMTFLFGEDRHARLCGIRKTKKQCPMGIDHFILTKTQEGLVAGKSCPGYIEAEKAMKIFVAFCILAGSFPGIFKTQFEGLPMFFFAQSGNERETCYRGDSFRSF
jgi:hypothetical protein